MYCCIPVLYKYGNISITKAKSDRPYIITCKAHCAFHSYTQWESYCKQSDCHMLHLHIYTFVCMCECVFNMVLHTHTYMHNTLKDIHKHTQIERQTDLKKAIAPHSFHFLILHTLHFTHTHNNNNNNGLLQVWVVLGRFAHCYFRFVYYRLHVESRSMEWTT